MKRKGLIWILIGTAMLIVFTITLLLNNTNDLQTGKSKVEKLPKDQAIMVESRAERFGVQKGDAFLYFVDVLYNPQLVYEIDKTSLEKNVKLEPFEIRDIQHTDFKLDSNTRVYRLQYELQLINGDVDYLYHFPSIVVTYKLMESEGFREIPGVAEPVYIASRLPEDPTKFQLGDFGVNYLDEGYGILRPLKGEVEETGKNFLPWSLIIAGGLLAIGSLIDINLRVIPQRKEEKEKARIDKNKMISQAYHSLYLNIEKAIATDHMLYQISHIARLVLTQKENFDWLDELKIDRVPSGIREPVISLFTITQNMGINDSDQKNMDECLKYLDMILKFYYQEEVDSWKN